jgi:hypothetical protein
MTGQRIVAIARQPSEQLLRINLLSPIILIKYLV